MTPEILALLDEVREERFGDEVRQRVALLMQEDAEDDPVDLETVDKFLAALVVAGHPLDRPTNVIEGLARVEAEIGGIRKLTKAQRQAAGMTVDESGQAVPWPYRGIDQICQQAQPLLGKYGVVIVPKVTNHIVDPVPHYGKEGTWFDTTVHVTWTIYGPGGPDDKIKSRTIGVGRDNSDKGINKAMTVAYKNLLLRLLSIGDPQDDLDHTNLQPPADAGGEAFLTDEQAQQVVDFVVALDEPHKAAAKAEIAETWGSTKTIPADAWADVLAFTAKYDTIRDQDEAEQPTVAQEGTEGAETGPEAPESDEQATDDPGLPGEGLEGLEANRAGPDAPDPLAPPDADPEAVEKRRKELAEKKLAEAGLAPDGLPADPEFDLDPDDGDLPDDGSGY
jgi:hypothetical protein